MLADLYSLPDAPAIDDLHFRFIRAAGDAAGDRLHRAQQRCYAPSLRFGWLPAVQRFPLLCERPGLK